MTGSMIVTISSSVRGGCGFFGLRGISNYPFDYIHNFFVGDERCFDEYLAVFGRTITEDQLTGCLEINCLRVPAE